MKNAFDGQKFGKWTVLREIEAKNRQRRFLCNCDCGKIREIDLRNLVGGQSTQCRSCASKISGKKRANNYANKSIASLTAIRPTDKHQTRKNIIWEFLCSCGKTCEYDGKCVFGITTSPHVACPDCEKEMSVEYKRSLLPIEIAYAIAKHTSKVTHNFDISLLEYDILTTNKKCYFCGKLDGRCGLDRIDSSQEYTFNNCVPCCIICNRMKRNHSKEDFINHIKSIYYNCKNYE